MTSSPPVWTTQTTTALLDALRDTANQPAWSQVEFRYRRVIAALARRLGASESDAEDVAQQTLTEFVLAYKQGRYDRNKGRLSSWILGIAQRATLQVLRRSGRAAERPAAGETLLAEVAGEPELRTIWTDERDREILSRAMSMLRDEAAIDDRTLLAFELVALRNVPAAEVATQAKMSVEQVYVAKSRVTKRLRQLVGELTEAFEQDI